MTTAVLEVRAPERTGRKDLVSAHGYIRVYMPDHPHADPKGYVYEHRLVAERILGRYLETGELVHHRNGDRGDNRPDNLEVVSAAMHRVRCACGCGLGLMRYDTWGRPRKYVMGHNSKRRK